MPRWVTDKTGFDAAVASESPVIIDFTASWCGPCKMIGPVFDELSKSAGSLDFIKVDVDANKETSGACGIRSMPTFQVWAAGRKLEEFSGADAASLRALVQKYDAPLSADRPQPGDVVVLNGLSSLPELNGTEAEVQARDTWSSNGRIPVAVIGGAPRTVAVKPANITVQTTGASGVEPKPGAHVVVDGLKSKPELNRKRGVVQSRDQWPGNGRVTVLLSSNVSIAAKPENLTTIKRSDRGAPSAAPSAASKGCGSGGCGGCH